MEIDKNNINHKKIVINSICIGLLISMNFIAGILSVSGGIIIITIGILGLQIYSQKGVTISFKSALIILFIILYFLISFSVNRDNLYAFDYFLKFLIFGIVPLYMSIIKFETRLVIKYTTIIGLISLPILLMRDYNSLESGYKMGLSYSLLPIIFAAIIQFSYSKSSKLISILTIIPPMIIMINIGSRGAFVSLFIFLLLLFVTKIKYKSIRYLFLFSISITSFFIVEYAWTILNWIQFTLMKYDLSIYALDKTVLYYANEKLFNSRDFIWANALKGIKEFSIFGYGIGSYEVIYDIFIHNIFLQSLWEGGLIFFIPILLIFLKTLSVSLSSSLTDRNKHIFLIYLLSLSYFSLLFSSKFWMNQSFWLLVGLYINNNNKLFPKYNFFKFNYHPKYHKHILQEYK
ncbi:MAG: O-antigen ligase family protein [Candidatus Delongbacteria bacterium]|nr:O-antigen ligase family protein [Candidatus Delongbacteria bacterium]